MARGNSMTRWQGDATTILLLVVSCFSACSPSEHELRSNVSAKLDQLDRAARTAATAEEALEAYRRLEELATDADRPFAAIAARIGQGGAFLRIGQLDSAELVLRGAAGSAVAVGHDFNAAVAYDGLATVFERRGWIDSAIVALRYADTHAERRGEAHNLLARIRERLSTLEGR